MDLTWFFNLRFPIGLVALWIDILYKRKGEARGTAASVNYDATDFNREFAILPTNL